VRRYQENNREVVRDRVRRYRENNPEAVRDNQRRYRESLREIYDRIMNTNQNNENNSKK
jgi:phosphoenolpyruvate carboxylase